jgi:hypothetical protein
MPLFSLFVRFQGAGDFTTQINGKSPYDAIRAFLSTAMLREMTPKNSDWPTDYSLRDIYIFIPLEGLRNTYLCGLGIQAKYIKITIFQTSKRSSQKEKFCGTRRKMVTLR